MIREGPLTGNGAAVEVVYHLPVPVITTPDLLLAEDDDVEE
jgi:hypothetical protein